MKNNKSDNEKFLKTLIERKSREQLMDDYKSIKTFPAEYNLAVPAVIMVIILASVLLPDPTDNRLPIFLFAATVFTTFTMILVAINKKMDILFALELEREQASNQNADHELLRQFLKQQQESNEPK